MRSLNFKYIPLTFISSRDEIKKQVKNTIIMRYILDKYNNLQTLSDFLEDTKYGYTDSAKDKGTHKFLRITDIKDGNVDWEDVPFCNCENDSNYLLQEDDILIARTGGTTGKSFIVKGVKLPSVFASYLIRMRVSDKLNPDFLYVFLNSYVYWNQIIEMKMGSAQPNVNAEKLKRLIIPYCDLNIQNKIVEILYGNNLDADPELGKLKDTFSEIDYKIDLLEELKIIFEKNNNLKNRLRQSILQEAIQGKLVLQDPNDEPASVLLEKIKEEKERLIKQKKIKKEKSLSLSTENEIPYELPKGWEWVRLGDVVNFIGGYAFKSNTYIQNSNNQVIRLGNVKNDQILLDSNPVFISDTIGNENNKYLLIENDILVTMTGTRGKRDYFYTCLIKSEDISKKALYLNQRVGCLRCYKNINPQIINIFLKSSVVLDKIFETETGTANQGNIGATAISNLLIPIPPLTEQKRIVEKVDHLMTLCDELEKNIEQSKNDIELLMQSILQEAFKEKQETGE